MLVLFTKSFLPPAELSTCVSVYEVYYLTTLSTAQNIASVIGDGTGI